MLRQLVNKYKKCGLSGVKYAVCRALSRTLLPLRSPTVHPVQIALDEILKDDAFVIVQIGAYVGDSPNDPLYAKLASRLSATSGRLICVEPDREHFQRLVSNLGHLENVSFENAAISDRSGPAPFFRLAVNPVAHGFPEWLSQLGSLKEERMRSLWDNCERNPEYRDFYLKHRVEDTVDCITFAELLRRHNVAKVDLLQMDVEGYELELLGTIDFDRVPIRFVNYESALLHDFRDNAELIMVKNDYNLAHYDQDTFCFKDADRNLRDRWLSPRPAVIR